MQLIPIRELRATITRFRVSKDIASSDNGATDVLVRPSADSSRCEHGKANCDCDDSTSDFNSARRRDCTNRPSGDSQDLSHQRAGRLSRRNRGQEFAGRFGCLLWRDQFHFQSRFAGRTRHIHSSQDCQLDHHSSHTSRPRIESVRFRRHQRSSRPRRGQLQSRLCEPGPTARRL